MVIDDKIKMMSKPKSRVSKSESRGWLPCPHCGWMIAIKEYGNGLCGVMCPSQSPCNGSGLIVCFDKHNTETARIAWNERG